MRGVKPLVLAAGLLVLLSCVPPGAATLVGQQPTKQALDPDGITWFVPESVKAGHPVHAAVGVFTGSGFGTQMHQDLVVWVTLDDEVLLFTENVHEHHGLHVLTVTPHKEGVLRFWADDGQGDHHDHRFSEEIPMQGSGPQDPPAPHGEVAEVQVRPAALEPQELPILHHGLQVNLQTTGLLGISAPIYVSFMNASHKPHSQLFSITDPHGGLVASLWPDTTENWFEVKAPIPDGTVHVRSLVLPHPAGDEGVFSNESRLDVSTDPVLPPVLHSLADPQDLVPNCADAPGRLVLDPNSVLLEPLVAWQENSDIRVHYLSQDRLDDPFPSSIRYTISQWPVQTDPLFVAATDHPFGLLSFRPPSPGHYVILVEEKDGSDFAPVCTTRVQVLFDPSTTMGPGTLDVQMDVEGSKLAVDLASKGTDGSDLPHYEFDVHVVRLADEEPAWLAWRGKLHGHDGNVGFIMDHLLPGEYELRVHPSPQDAGIPPLASEGGFVYPFSIADDDTMDAQDTDERPAPLPVVPVLIVFVLTALSLRRVSGGRR